jgi:hypothetical protein
MLAGEVRFGRSLGRLFPDKAPGALRFSHAASFLVKREGCRRAMAED